VASVYRRADWPACGLCWENDSSRIPPTPPLNRRFDTVVVRIRLLAPACFRGCCIYLHVYISPPGSVAVFSFLLGSTQTRTRQILRVVEGCRRTSPLRHQAQMSKRFLRKLAPGGCFPRINMSPNATDEKNAGSLPQPPPTKRARTTECQSVLSGLSEPIPFSPLPIPNPLPKVPTKTASPAGTAVLPAKVLPGRRRDDVSIRQYARGDKSLALAIATDPYRTANALDLINDRSYAASGKLPRESKFGT
jgi:hypothetical protein